MAKGPVSANIRSYHVGFGDCFLLSFRYDDDKERHVLIDFGSTGLPEGTPATRMADIAEDIRRRTNGKLTAVVATHRHKDHISGFETKNGKGTGDVIRGLKPKVVVQPWTEDPDLEPDAEGPAMQGGATHIRALGLMQVVAQLSFDEARKSRHFAKPLKQQLAFLGDDNLANRSAVENLMSMAPNDYVYSGKRSKLSRLLPGVAVDVLGPPTVKQTDSIKKQRSRDPDEFWQFQARAMQSIEKERVAKGRALFPRHVRSRGPRFPIEARWLIYHARAIRGDQLLQIVRMLDTAMNNTSVILLFRVKKKTLLFPGDAQIENWKFALGQKAYLDLLKKVDFYKVGHHGSLNATPRSLWGAFEHRSPDEHAPGRLTSVVSTMEGKHGSVGKSTEVPRKTLVQALKNESDFFTTQDLSGAEFFHDTEIVF